MVVTLGLGALLLNRGDDTPDPVQAPVTTPVPTTVAGEDEGAAPKLSSADEPLALAAVVELNNAVTAGDLDRVAELSEVVDPDATRANSRMWEMNAYIAAEGRGLEIGEDCRVTDSYTGFIRIDCPATATDPVWLTMGAVDFDQPMWYLPGGTLRWLPTEGEVSSNAAYRAYVVYLTEFHPDDYAAVCDPHDYDFMTVDSARGLAFTRECAELWVPLQDEVAAWIVETEYGQDWAYAPPT